MNLECIGGVSFNKGCYTGQEIVSAWSTSVRQHGAPRFLPAVRHFPQEATSPMPGGTVAGTVVLSAAAGSKAAVLAQVAADKTADTYRADEAVLTALSLPYSYSRSDK